MNLPEYRRALRQAHDKFAAAVSEAAERLAKEVAEMDSLFHDEQDGPKAIYPEDVAVNARRW